MRARDRIQTLMDEHIRMPGCPHLIVTRGQAYSFLVGCGFPKIGGFGSVDYMVFSRDQVADPLSDSEFRIRMFACMQATHEEEE